MKPPFTPGERVRVHYNVGEDVYQQRGFFVAQDETGVLLKGPRGWADTIFVPADRVVMIVSTKVAGRE